MNGFGSDGAYMMGRGGGGVLGEDMLGCVCWGRECWGGYVEGRCAGVKICWGRCAREVMLG